MPNIISPNTRITTILFDGSIRNGYYARIEIAGKKNGHKHGTINEPPTDDQYSNWESKNKQYIKTIALITLQYLPEKHINNTRRKLGRCEYRLVTVLLHSCLSYFISLNNGEYNPGFDKIP